MMRQRLRHGVVLLGACAGLSAVWGLPAWADVVHLTSGRTKEGIVVEEGEKVVKLETGTGVVGIPLAVIESLEYASKDENRALRRAWADAERQRQRQRAQRRAARRAKRAAEESAGAGTVVIDGKRVSPAEASRRAGARARQIAQERKRVEAFTRSQTKLDRDLRATGPLAIQGISVRPSEGGTSIYGQLLNISGVVQRDIRIDAELVEEAGTENERIAARRVIIVAELGVDRIHPLDVQFPFTPERPVTPRLTVAGSNPAR